MVRQSADKGFSLIEALVAMTVLSVSASTLLAAVEEHTRSIAAVSDRANALWIAEDRLIELGIGIDDLPFQIRADGRTWWVDTQHEPTKDPDLVRVNITVGRADDQEAALARLTGFLDISGGGS